MFEYLAAEEGIDPKTVKAFRFEPRYLNNDLLAFRNRVMNAGLKDPYVSLTGLLKVFNVIEFVDGGIMILNTPVSTPRYMVECLEKYLEKGESKQMKGERSGPSTN